MPSTPTATSLAIRVDGYRAVDLFRAIRLVRLGASPISPGQTHRWPYRRCSRHGHGVPHLETRWATRPEADVLLTCDDRLLRRGRRLRKKLRIEIENPIHWLQEHADAPDT